MCVPYPQRSMTCRKKRSSLYGTRGSHIWLPKSTRQGVIKVQWFSQRTMSQLARFDIGGYVHESSPLVINSHHESPLITGWSTYPSENMTSSVGMMKFPINMGSHNPAMFQTFPNHQPVTIYLKRPEPLREVIIQPCSKSPTRSPLTSIQHHSPTRSTTHHPRRCSRAKRCCSAASTCRSCACIDPKRGDWKSASFDQWDLPRQHQWPFQEPIDWRYLPYVRPM